MQKLLKNKFGFTLIELLVVIAIIGLLSSMTVYLVNSSRVKAKIATQDFNTRLIIRGLYNYYLDHGYLPSSYDCSMETWCQSSNNPGTWIPNFSSYIENIPEMADYKSAYIRNDCFIAGADCGNNNDPEAKRFRLRLNIRKNMPCPTGWQLIEGSTVNYCYWSGNCETMVNCG